MWVMTPDGVGVLFNLGSIVSRVHLVNINDGTTYAEVDYGNSILRQAKYNEIPECRRGESREWFKERGYN